MTGTEKRSRTRSGSLIVRGGSIRWLEKSVIGSWKGMLLVAGKIVLMVVTNVLMS